jgi:hypothetical protein
MATASSRRLSSKRRGIRPTELRKVERRAGDPSARTSPSCSQGQGVPSCPSSRAHPAVPTRRPRPGRRIVAASGKLGPRRRPALPQRQVPPQRRNRPVEVGRRRCQSRRPPARYGCGRGRTSRVPTPHGVRTTHPERPPSTEPYAAPGEAIAVPSASGRPARRDQLILLRGRAFSYSDRSTCGQ